MSDHAQAFVLHLKQLDSNNRGALAALRRSLGFSPGQYAAAYPYVERFVPADCHADDSRRRALYLVAGLFALHTKHAEGRSFSAAFADLKKERKSDSIEKRFIALLSADAETLPNHLRQAFSLLDADDFAVDYTAFLDDLFILLNPFALERRDSVRQKWARSFYQALTLSTQSAEPTT